LLLSVGVEWRAFVFFCFQAEDGIRDATVTGVQTCALPISRSAMPRRARMVGVTSTLPAGTRTVAPRLKSTPQARHVLRTFHGLRSEERRVGRECRAGRGAHQASDEVRGQDREGESRAEPVG